MPLRWKILLFTVPPLLALTFGTVWLVNRSVSEQVDRSVRADLARASVVFKTMYSARARELAVAGQVIVQDPRFFSVLTLPGGVEDAQVQATVHGVASEFHEITGADVFEVVDTKNRTLATVGGEKVDGPTRADLVREALRGGPITGVARDPNRHLLVAATPVRAGGRIVGVLLLARCFGTVW